MGDATAAVFFDDAAASLASLRPGTVELARLTVSLADRYLRERPGNGGRFPWPGAAGTTFVIEKKLSSRAAA